MAEYVCGNIFIREMEFLEKGQIVEGHRHNFPHVTYADLGELLIEALDDDNRVIRAVTKKGGTKNNWLLIEAGKKHRITAKTDYALAHCVYSHRDPQGEVVQEYDGWLHGYR